MKKEVFEIHEIDEQKGIIRVTTPGERWYAFPEKDSVTGMPRYIYEPSITFITSYYPKGIEYVKWVANKGLDQAEQVKVEAGDRGTIVHHAAERLLNGEILNIESKVKDREGAEREMTAEEYYGAMTFKEWFDTTQPKVLAVEQTVRSKQYGFAGTLDICAEINGEIWIIDIKTSKYVYASHELQVSALKQAWNEQNEQKATKVAILQVAYDRNKMGYKFTEIEDQFEDFLHTKGTWWRENKNVRIPQREYPLELSLNIKKNV